MPVSKQPSFKCTWKVLGLCVVTPRKSGSPCSKQGLLEWQPLEGQEELDIIQCPTFHWVVCPARTGYKDTLFCLAMLAVMGTPPLSQVELEISNCTLLNPENWWRTQHSK